jgi:hypothetical protein
MNRFQFSPELKKELKDSGRAWDDLLYRACLEAKEKEVRAKEFADVLRKTGFRCGTGPARAAYKAVRDGADQRGMVAAVTAVKAKRKANTATNTATDTATDTASDTATNTANTANTLVGAIQSALEAARAGHLEVAETWLAKAQAMIDTAKAQKIA